MAVASLLNMIEKKTDSGHGGPGKEDAARIAEDQHGDSSRIRTAKRSTAGSTPEAMRMNAPEEGQISRELADAGESS